MERQKDAQTQTQPAPEKLAKETSPTADNERRQSADQSVPSSAGSKREEYKGRVITEELARTAVEVEEIRVKNQTLVKQLRRVNFNFN